MATTEQFQERLRRAVREAVQKCLAEGDLPEAQEGEARFTTIETLALVAGDAVSLEVFEQQLAESGMGPPHCPRCGFEGKRIKQRQRTLQTRRGLEVPLREHECYCPGCRRAFFPSLPDSGAGRGV
jgi:predicted Zn-ribbon and HTH transcriptional regulator